MFSNLLFCHKFSFYFHRNCTHFGGRFVPGPGSFIDSDFLLFITCKHGDSVLSFQVKVFLVLLLHLGPPSEKAVAPYSSTLAWKIPWTDSLVGCSPWGHEELDTTEQLHFDFSLSCVGEGNGNPLQCSCLENPRDGGAWWAAVYGVAQSWTRLKRLSSCSSSSSRTSLPFPAV